MAKRRTRGRSDAFTTAQNKSLRAALGEIAEGVSQQQLAVKLGVVQQTASRLLNDKHAGFSYPTAIAVARLAGFAGVDAFFVAKGVASESTTLMEDAQLHARAG